MHLICHDLKEHGVDLVAPDAPEFSDLAREVLSHPGPFEPPPLDALGPSAVLINRSGKAIIAMIELWRYRASDGRLLLIQNRGLMSSSEVDVLAGLAPVNPTGPSCIRSGSKRIITNKGNFGDNSDVLPSSRVGLHRGPYSGLPGQIQEGKAAQIELQLDLVFFDDGLCVGPDENHRFEDLKNDLETQRATASTIVETIRKGAPRGEVFEIIRPVARATPPRGPNRIAIQSFAHQALHNLIELENADLLEWFERAAAVSADRLHRPE